MRDASSSEVIVRASAGDENLDERSGTLSIAPGPISGSRPESPPRDVRAQKALADTHEHVGEHEPCGSRPQCVRELDLRE